MSRYEQPRYSVVASGPDYELRSYESYMVAETTVAGGFGSTGNVAFRRLAGFIFGRNTHALRMNMTVPVTHQPNGNGTQKYRFVMERTYSEESLPHPLDGTISLIRVPAGLYAARRYRGGRSEAKYRKVEFQLVAALKRDGIETSGTPAAAIYSGPATPAPLRRNDVLVPVVWPMEQAA